MNKKSFFDYNPWVWLIQELFLLTPIEKANSKFAGIVVEVYRLLCIVFEHYAGRSSLGSGLTPNAKSVNKSAETPKGSVFFSLA